MPTRRDIFTDKGIYHVFNKTIDHKKIFLNNKYANEFLQRVWFYRSNASNIRYSFYNSLTGQAAKALEAKIDDDRTYKVEIIAYCLMPNHFHFLLRQKRGGSTKQVMPNINEC